MPPSMISMTDTPSTNPTPGSKTKIPIRADKKTDAQETPKKTGFYGFVDSILTAMRASTNWKYNVPSPSSPNTFPTLYTDSYFEKWFKRVPAASFIVQDMAKDSWEKGFHLRGSTGDELKDEDTIKIYNTFNDLFLDSLIKATSLKRLNGKSVILLGYNDLAVKFWDQKVLDKAQIRYTVAVSANGGFMVTEWGGIPEVPKALSIPIFTNLPTNIHPDRILYLENTDSTDLSQHGVSVLNPVGDAISTMQDVTWSIGQRIYRAASSIITLIGPKGIKPAEANPIIEGWLDINSKFVGFLPSNWKMQVDSLGKALGNPERDFDVLLAQVSIGARVPLSVLKGSPKGATGSKDRDMADYYQTISALQNTENVPLVKKILKLLIKSGQITVPEVWNVEFNQIAKKSFREQAIDIAGESLALELDTMIKSKDTTKEEKLELIKLLMLPGSLKE